MDEFQTTAIATPHAGEDERPEWLVKLEAEAGDLTARWYQLLAFVADTANETGFFSPAVGGWPSYSGMGIAESNRLAETFLAAGGLKKIGDRLYVVDWRETYRQPD